MLQRYVKELQAWAAAAQAASSSAPFTNHMLER